MLSRRSEQDKLFELLQEQGYHPCLQIAYCQYLPSLVFANILHTSNTRQDYVAADTLA